MKIIFGFAKEHLTEAILFVVSIVLTVIIEQIADIVWWQWVVFIVLQPLQ